MAAGDDEVTTTTTAATVVDASSTSSSTTEAAGSAPAGSGDDDVEAVTTTSAGPSTTVRRGPVPTGATTTAKPTTTTAAAPATTTTRVPGRAAITIENFTFQPAALRVAAGSTVTVTNKDGVPHTWSADGGQWESGTLSRDGAFSHRFDDTGTFRYHCEIHTFMEGTVQVG